MSRYVLTDAIHAYREKYLILDSFEIVLEWSPFQACMAARLSTLLPYGPTNVVFGSSTASIFPFISATILGLGIYDAVVIFSATSVKSLTEEDSNSPEQKAMLVGGIVISILFIIGISYLTYRKYVELQMNLSINESETMQDETCTNSDFTISGATL